MISPRTLDGAVHAYREVVFRRYYDLKGGQAAGVGTVSGYISTEILDEDSGIQKIRVIGLQSPGANVFGVCAKILGH